MSLKTYHQKRDFKQTPEPEGKISKEKGRRFVCQEHHASSLHFDFRLEIGGVLKSWSLRKGPSMNPAVRRLAVPTEDHPVEYLAFEGRIPEGNYGAGEHLIWDSGTYVPAGEAGAEEQFQKGKLKFELRGSKLKGMFNLFRLGSREQWLLVKSRDEHADEEWKLELIMPDEEGRQFIEEKRPRTRRRTPRVAAAPKRDEGVVKTPARPVEGEDLRDLDAVLAEKEPAGDRRVRVGEYAVDLTSLDRIYWKETELTKADLIRYYFEISDYILPYLANRPLIMKRYPAGIEGKSFHQHDVDEVPEYVRTITLEAEDRGLHTVDYIVGDNLQTHLYLANMGAIERHPWHSRTSNLAFPDWFVFDLDPGEDVKFETICEAAVRTGEVVEKFGLSSYAKTSGSRGIHVYVPVEAKYPFDQIADLAALIAGQVASENPKIATVERSKSKRKKNQVYVDHLQNAYGKSVVAPYSVRPRPGATVSAPLDWNEIEKAKISIEDFTIENMLERVRKKGDLFKPALTAKQPLERALKEAAKRHEK